jgi:hypothetical protein
LINTAKFTIAAGAMTLILGAIQAAAIGTGWRLLFTVIVTVIAVMLTKPVASFKSMAGMDANHSVVGGLLRRAAGTALGVFASRKVDGEPSSDAPDPRAQPTLATQPSPTPRYQPVEPSMPPLPSPQAQHAPLVAAVEAPGWAGAQQFALDRGRPTAAELPSRVDGHAALPGSASVTGGAPIAMPPAIEQSAVELPDGPARRVDWSQAAADPAALVAPGVVHRAPVQQAGFQPRQDGVQISGEVVYPTGVVIARDSRLYRSGEGVVQPEEYVRFPEPQVDANGDVAWVPMYHARSGR